MEIIMQGDIKYDLQSRDYQNNDDNTKNHKNQWAAFPRTRTKLAPRESVWRCSPGLWVTPDSDLNNLRPSKLESVSCIYDTVAILRGLCKQTKNIEFTRQIYKVLKFSSKRSRGKNTRLGQAPDA